MKKFILKTLLLILPFIILAITAEYMLQQIPNDYSHKKEYLDKHSGEIKILIFGSSHAYFNINPVYFSQNTFNASHISQSLDFDLAILQKYQNKLSSLKMIVLPISYSTLFGNLGIGIEAWRVKNYTLYYGINATSIDAYSELLSGKLGNNIHRLYDYYIDEKNNISCTELGWGTSYRAELSQNLQETGSTAAQRHTIKDMLIEKRIKIFEENIKILNSFAVYCSQRNIKLIFVTTPTYHTYRENLNSEQLNKAVETITAFAEKHPNCYYFNWLDDANFIVKDFYDADHLNEIGAEKLSKKLTQVIDSLWMMENNFN